MPTGNKRVAAYLPPHLVEKFEDFKIEHSLGDSQALIFILSQFLGAAHPVTQSSSDYSDILDKRINQLKHELKDELLSELLLSIHPSLSLDDKFTTLLEQFKELESRVSSLPSELLSESLVDKEFGEPSSELLQPMTGAALNKRFNQAEGGVTKMKSKHKNNPQRFTEWTKTKDPDGICWEFKEGLYYPLI